MGNKPFQTMPSRPTSSEQILPPNSQSATKSTDGYHAPTLVPYLWMQEALGGHSNHNSETIKVLLLLPRYLL